jgi:hypothetical protein
MIPSDDLVRDDYFRAVMYTDIAEQLAGLDITGTGIEWGGSNGVIQRMLPGVQWENRDYPEYDVCKAESWSPADVVVADQVLEHVMYPWKAIEYAGIYTRDLAIVTVPFLIGVHPCPEDCWRMTPSTLRRLAEPYFSHIEIRSWGNADVAYWHAKYNDTGTVLRNVPEGEWRHSLTPEANDLAKPFVIWMVARK